MLLSRCVVDVPPSLWACAEIIAKARKKSNESTRLSRQDRGSLKNFKGDLAGSFGELMVYNQALKTKSRVSVRHMRKNMFDPRGGGRKKSVDLVLPDNSRVDVKTFDCDPRKRYFAINVKGHQKLKDFVDYYYGVLSPLYGKSALLTDMIPYHDVVSWPTISLGKYGDPSYVLDLEELCSKYAGAVYHQLCLDKHTGDDIISQRESVSEKMLLHFPSLKGFL